MSEIGCGLLEVDLSQDCKWVGRNSASEKVEVLLGTEYGCGAIVFPGKRHGLGVGLADDVHAWIGGGLGALIGCGRSAVR